MSSIIAIITSAILAYPWASSIITIISIIISILISILIWRGRLLSWHCKYLWASSSPSSAPHHPDTHHHPHTGEGACYLGILMREQALYLGFKAGPAGFKGRLIGLLQLSWWWWSHFKNNLISFFYRPSLGYFQSFPNGWRYDIVVWFPNLLAFKSGGDPV